MTALRQGDELTAEKFLTLLLEQEAGHPDVLRFTVRCFPRGEVKRLIN